MPALQIYKKLSEIQTALKCPKSQYNSFGKYRYRSLEDILEAVKPTLEKTGTAVVLQDEIVEIGSRVYVKSTAKLIDVETAGEVCASAFAREQDDKKGMDAAQITGGSSSYARKYALNGLFAIDDTKDADYLQCGEDAVEKTPEKVTEGQIKLIKALVKDEKTVCDYYKISNIAELTKGQANLIITKKGGHK